LNGVGLGLVKLKFVFYSFLMNEKDNFLGTWELK
jgi:hypothetical protein